MYLGDETLLERGYVFLHDRPAPTGVLPSIDSELRLRFPFLVQTSLEARADRIATIKPAQKQPET